MSTATAPHIPCPHCGNDHVQLQLRELQRSLAARDKTIAMLSRRLEGAPVGVSHSTTSAMQAMGLEKIVARKTAELERERFALEKTLTELRSTQVKLLQAHKMEAIGQLAAGVAHEINTPTQYVTDNVEFLERGVATLWSLLDTALLTVEATRRQEPPHAPLAQLDALLARARLDYLREQMPRALGESRDGLARVTRIVGAMKEFSHTSTDQKQEARLQDVIEMAVTVARSEWKYVAELAVECDPDVPPVLCLRQELSQVVINLVVNAAHALKDRGARDAGDPPRIVVSLRRSGPYAEIRVADNGSGIPEEIRRRVFDPFFTTKPVGEGTGQGLAIAYSIVVDKHGGQISLESTVGKGTTFVVQLPMEAPVDAAADPTT